MRVASLVLMLGPWVGAELTELVTADGDLFAERPREYIYIYIPSVFLQTGPHQL